MQQDRPSRPRSLRMFSPGYNDGGTITSLVIRAVQVAGRLGPDFEIIVGRRRQRRERALLGERRRIMDRRLHPEAAQMLAARVAMAARSFQKGRVLA